MRNRILALQIQHPIPRAHPFRKGKTADRTHGRFTNPRGGSSFATTFIGILNSRFSTMEEGQKAGVQSVSAPAEKERLFACEPEYLVGQEQDSKPGR